VLPGRHRQNIKALIFGATRPAWQHMRMHAVAARLEMTVDNPAHPGKLMVDNTMDRRIDTGLGLLGTPEGQLFVI
jgi:hypothetical protein